MKPTREEKANLRHALLHLEANKIYTATSPTDIVSGSWYCGNKENFIKRHKKSIATIKRLLEST